MKPFWPRRSPHFLKARVAVRPYLEGKPVAVGLSGGADSLALTAALLAEGADVTALCIDHGLQDGSRVVAETAARTARELGARAEVISVEVKPGSLEAAARRARYRAFADFDGDVFVAHTADDQAETVLLGALRGQVTGMADRAVIEGARVVRPLLGLRRADTEGACAELGLNPWEDPHNQDPTFRRVALRTDIIPRLGELVGGDAVGALASAGALAAEDNQALAQTPETDCMVLAGLDPARRRRAIAAWLVEEDVEVTRASLSAIAALCTQWRGQGGVAVAPAGTTNGSKRLEVRRVGGKLTVMRFNNAPQ